MRSKIVTLQRLCEFSLDTSRAQRWLNNYEEDSLRVVPLGRDARSSVYWYFYGTRLYREDPAPKSRAKRSKEQNQPPGTVWQVVCFTPDDWQTLTNRFKGSRNEDERALYKTLFNDFMPEIPKLFLRKEQLRRQK